METFVVFNLAINVNGEWFLPFQQEKLLNIVRVPLVPHITRSGYKITSTKVLHDHYVVERNGLQYNIPIEAGNITNEIIPEEWVNRYILEERYRSDNIKDYILAAQKYLNIKITGGPSIAYFRRRSRKTKDLVGVNLNKDEIQKKQLQEDI